jgi:multisubunit Na+/H+ antiporter MnhB subunit
MLHRVNPSKPLSTLSWFCAGTGTLVPGYAFFTTYPPPIFPGISILTSVLSAAIIYITFTYNPKTPSGDKRFKRLIRWAAFSIVMVFGCLLVYVLLLRYCTVLDPQNYSQRFQIGFWKFDWSLTEAGLTLKRNIPLAPLEDWMMREGAFRQGGPEIIWQAWSVVTAGCILVFTYMAGFVLWTVGFSFIARSHRQLKIGNTGETQR